MGVLISQRMRRGPAQASCVGNYPITKLYNMPLIYNFSDHAPILLSTNGKATKTKTHSKFENWWLKEDDFQTHAKKSWQQSIGKPYHSRANHLAASLKIWCKKKSLCRRN
jgi:hypothetical protein